MANNLMEAHKEGLRIGSRISSIDSKKELAIVVLGDEVEVSVKDCLTDNEPTAIYIKLQALKSLLRSFSGIIVSDWENNNDKTNRL